MNTHRKAEYEGGGINPCVMCRDGHAGIRSRFNDSPPPPNDQKEDE
jgi:hypothetical protein